jgi:hypothetical protein
MEHKIAAYRHSLLLTPKRKQAEWSLIQLIAQNNNFPQKLIQNLEQKTRCRKTNQEDIDGKKSKK